jgi:hypothetical protein
MHSVASNMKFDASSVPAYIKSTSVMLWRVIPACAAEGYSQHGQN